MTVYELIRKASQLPPDAPVQVSNKLDDHRFTVPVRAAHHDYSRLVIVVDSVGLPQQDAGSADAVTTSLGGDPETRSEEIP